MKFYEGTTTIDEFIQNFAQHYYIIFNIEQEILMQYLEVLMNHVNKTKLSIFGTVFKDIESGRDNIVVEIIEIDDTADAKPFFNFIINSEMFKDYIIDNTDTPACSRAQSRAPSPSIV